MLFQQSWRSSHICWVLVRCFSFTLRSNSSQSVSIGLRSGDRGGQVIWCSTPLFLGQIALTQPGGVLGHCPVEKQMIVPLSAYQMGWHIAADCCVPWILNKSLTVSPEKHLPQHPTFSSMLHGGKPCMCMQWSSIQLLCVSQRHSGWNQKSHIWTRQTKGQISTGLMSIACVSWPKKVSSYWCASVVVSFRGRPIMIFQYRLLED